MAMIQTADGRIKVKRDGPRGWHWIAAANYDPAIHELVDQPAADLVPPAAPEHVEPVHHAHKEAAHHAHAPEKRGPGRPRKH